MSEQVRQFHNILLIKRNVSIRHSTWLKSFWFYTFHIAIWKSADRTLSRRRLNNCTQVHIEQRLFLYVSMWHPRLKRCHRFTKTNQYCTRCSLWQSTIWVLSSALRARRFCGIKSSHILTAQLVSKIRH